MIEPDSRRRTQLYEREIYPALMLHSYGALKSVHDVR